MTTSTGAVDGVVRVVPARVGLVGNPSDGYGGAVLAMVVPELSATVSACEADHVEMAEVGSDDTARSWQSVTDWRDDAARHGHGDRQRVISASLWALVEHLGRRTPAMLERGIAVRWSTTIPRSVGLAGSSALAVGTIDAAAAAWGVELDRRVVAALALHAERDVLGITAGWQDRIVQSHGCTVLVDAARMEMVDGVEVPVVHRPAVRLGADATLSVAWAAHAASPSGDYHSAVRRTADRLGRPMAELADLARRSAAALARGDVGDLAAAIDAGWLLRQSCAPLAVDHAAVVEAVRAEGLPATTPGSGGSVVALCTDAVAVERAEAAARRAGCAVVRCPIVRTDRDRRPT